MAAIARAAEAWDANWSPGIGGGRLELPVVAGLRRGLLRGRLDVRAEGGGSRLTLSVEAASWRLHGSAVVVLLLGALGAIPVLFWPLHANLLALAPAGLILTLVAWFLVASRLRSAGAEQFLETAQSCLEE